MTDDLDVLDPVPVEVVYRGERLEIRPLELLQISAVVRLARPLLERLLDSDVETDEGTVEFILSAIAEDMETVVKIAAVVSDRPVEWAGKGSAADLLRLGRAVFEVNRDFFAQLPALLRGEWTGRETKSTTGDGPTPSSASSSAGTG